MRPVSCTSFANHARAEELLVMRKSRPGLNTFVGTSIAPTENYSRVNVKG